MTRRLVYKPQAHADLDAIYDYITAGNQRRAVSYIEEIRRECRKICATPMMGRERADLRPGLRIISRWRRIIIAYDVLPDRVRILRIFSAGQDYEAILGEEADDE